MDGVRGQPHHVLVSALPLRRWLRARQERGRPVSDVAKLVTILAAVGLLIGMYVWVQHLRRGDPDPGHRTERLMHTAVAQLPDDIILRHRISTPFRWQSSCNGRRGTDGWMPSTLVVEFSGSTPAELAVFSRDLAQRGWRVSDTATGATISWKHALDGHSDLVSADLARTGSSWIFGVRANAAHNALDPGDDVC